MNLRFATINMFSVRLRHIDLSWNKIASLPEDIVKIPSLQTLKLSHNLLTKMPREMWRLKSLEQLHLACNQLGHLWNRLGEF